MNWLEYLELTYPNHLLPFDLRGVNQLLKMQMKAQAVAYDSVVETSLIQLRGLLDRAGFYCAPGAMGKAVVSPSSLPNSAFEDDFDDSGFENLLSSEKPLVKRTYSDNPELIDQYQSQHDRHSPAYSELFRVNQQLVRKIAGHYSRTIKRTSLEIDDLVGYGNEGLIKAIEKFDPALGFAFSTYATWWIRQSITRCIMDEGWTVRLPVHLGEKLNKLRKIENQQLQTLHHLDISSLCQQLEVTTTEYYQLHQWEYQYRGAVSLNQLIASGDGDDTEIEELVNQDLSGQLLPPVDPQIQVLNLDVIQRTDQLIDKVLSSREAMVIRERFGMNADQSPKTLEEVGHMYGVTRERIRQIEARALKKLQNHIENRKEEYQIED